MEAESQPAQPVWMQEWSKNLTALQEIEDRFRQTRPVPFQILRVNQVDAATLDTEISSILKTSFMKIFEWFPVSEILLRVANLEKKWSDAHCSNL
jgi:hypothetical protein